MKHLKSVKMVAAPGFLMESDFLNGKQTLGFFGLREKVTFSAYYLNPSIK